MLLLLISNLAFAKDVKVRCLEGFSCQTISQKIKKSLKGKESLSEIRENLRFLLLDSSIKELKFNHSSEGLVVEFTQRPLIKEVLLSGKLGLDENVIKKTLRLSEGGFYDSTSLSKGIERLILYYKERGYENVQITPNITQTDAGVLLNFNIDTGNFVLIKDVEVSSESDFLGNLVKSRLGKFKGKPWNMVNIKIELDALTRDLFGRGYFFSSLKLLETEIVDSKKVLKITVNVGLLYNFDFRGNKVISRGEILQELKEFLLNNFEEVNTKLLSAAIVRIYEKRGVYRTNVKHRAVDGVSKSGDRFKNIYFVIEEGKKVPVKKLVFKGTGGIPLEEVEDYYYENTTALAGRDYLDKSFISDFPALLKRLYLARGYLFIEVGEPLVTFSVDETYCNITFHVNERQQSIVEEIRYPNVDKALRDKLTGELINKVGGPLNVVELEEDISTSLNILREEGYYFARLKTTDPSKLILHENNFNRSRIVIDFDLGKKTKFESVLVTGHQVTKQKVIVREIRLEKDDIVTPEKVQKIKERIASLGLFSQIKITPFVTNRDSAEDVFYVNLLVQVTEKDFGSGEIAPGYRTDIGYKISTKLAYNNILGLNHSASIKAQTNIRDNLNSLDIRRKNENRNLIEYSLRFNYNWPYAFPSRIKFLHNIELGTSLSWQQRRLFSFDAEIKRGSLTLNKEITDEISTSLKYQYEDIRQFDSSQDKDNATFTIGGITPSINFDFRDSSVNPRKGAFFGLSWEFANPAFFSMEKSDLEINFWKLVSRNKFYYPISKNWTLALSISSGAQKNLVKDVLLNSDGSTVINENGEPQTKGFIPSIKVFRLDGPDSVRGYATSEINRLSTGSDVSEIRVQDRAFFTNIKFEPRYSLNDQIVIGPFFDAGKIYVNNFKPLELRTSTGVSLKFVTQVGTLDFDYGFKLKRNRLSDGGREGFGRFHLQIGFF